MSPDERERLARLEEQVKELRSDMTEVKTDVKGILTAANMGKGAWLALLKIGGILLAIAGLIAWVADFVVNLIRAH